MHLCAFIYILHTIFSISSKRLLLGHFNTYLIKKIIEFQGYGRFIKSVFTLVLLPFQPKADDKHTRWLHLRIRPSSFPFTDTANYTAHGKVKSKALVDGRWTLAFRDEESCKHAFSMVQDEIKLQSCAVERSLQPVLELDRSTDDSNPPQHVEDNSV